MNRITWTVFCLILWFYGVHGNIEHLKSHRNPARHHPIRRNVISSDIVSPERSISMSSDNILLKFLSHLRTARGLSAIYCKTDSDCKRFSANSVCMYYTPLSISFCIPDPDLSNTAASTTYSMYMICTLIVFGLILRNRLI